MSSMEKKSPENGTIQVSGHAIIDEKHLVKSLRKPMSQYSLRSTQQDLIDSPRVVLAGFIKL